MANDKKVPIFDLLRPIVEARPESNPWLVDADGAVSYEADVELLENLLAIPIREKATPQSGRLAKSIDAWIVNELKRAGFTDHEVWPRLGLPRVLPRDLLRFVDKLPRAVQDTIRAQLHNNSTLAPSEAKVLGRAYVKQVDVVIADWSTGPEVLISTKSMGSSFDKNLANRFEESYGDAKNLRGRYPLAAMGYVYLLRSTAEGGTTERVIDMLRKLKAENDVYDATCLLIGEWDDTDDTMVRILPERVPVDIGIGRFYSTMIDSVLERTPVDMHVEVRQRREHRDLPLSESE